MERYICSEEPRKIALSDFAMISFVKSNLTQDFSNNSIDLRFRQVNVDVALIFRYGTA